MANVWRDNIELDMENILRSGCKCDGRAMMWKVNHQWSRRGGHAGQKKRGNGVSFSKPRTPLYHRIHKFKSSVVKSIVDLGVNSRFIHSDPDLIRTHFMASTTPPQIAVAVVRHLSSSNLALL